jgi:NH3-dependent NAD+ synthetase
MSIESSKTAKRNALRVFEDSKIGRKMVDLTPVYETMKDTLLSTPTFTSLDDYNTNIMREPNSVDSPARQMSFANIKPRLRMTTLYQLAQEHNYLVIGTSNAAEIFLGYFTK